ncbi:(2Fe-2S)-binding protein [Paenibacillus kobensis]|uniref:(2Fe-2S)-binding protein n=1 Tax=Paenibacillus kobensis TaxID=59841 RepID=UPI000FDC6BFD|nr:(2Fe-2S)-binding protein [Paenibacillus kobensis]
MFKAEERQLMEQQFGLTFQPHPSPIASFKLSDLYDEPHMKRLLDVYTPLIQGLDPTVGGMYLTSSFILFSAALHYMVAIHPSAIDFSPERFTAEVVYIEGTYSYYTVRFRVDELVAVAIDPSRREQQRNELFDRLYSNTIRPLIELLSDVSGTPRIQMWGSFPRITYAYEHLIAIEQDPQRKQQLQDDFRYTTEEMPPDAFGTKRNPYKHTYRLLDNPYNPEQPYRMKPTCCNYYLTEGGYYCYTCPRLKPMEREERKQKILADLAAKQADG